MDHKSFTGGDIRALTASDKEIVANAVECVIGILELNRDVAYPDSVGLIRLYDNLGIQFGGDEQLMRHWVKTGNNHLGYTPVLRAHIPTYLEEMNAYLESFIR